MNDQNNLDKVLVDRDELRTLLDLIFCHATNEQLYKRASQMGIKYISPYAEAKDRLPFGTYADMLKRLANTTPIDDETVLVDEDDLTELRDRFAGQALQGIMGRTWDHLKLDDKSLIERWASSAYKLADAMLAAREVRS